MLFTTIKLVKLAEQILRRHKIIHSRCLTVISIRLAYSIEKSTLHKVIRTLGLQDAIVRINSSARSLKYRFGLPKQLEVRLVSLKIKANSLNFYHAFTLAVCCRLTKASDAWS